MGARTRDARGSVRRGRVRRGPPGPHVLVTLVAAVGLLVPAGTVTAAAGVRTAPPDVPTTFTHPGVHVSRPQLDFVRQQVQAGAQPWLRAYDSMMASRYASLSYTPHPRAVVECGPYSEPNHGCTEERDDAIAAYTHALAWSVTEDTRYAKKSIAIMNAWSPVIEDHTRSNAPLQTAWAGSVWPRAAEIIRYTDAGWAAADVDRFETMLRDVYLPEVIDGYNGSGNWELTMMEAAVGIAVFLDDRDIYSSARERFLVRVPAYIYLTSDGPVPRTVPGSGRDTPDEIFSYWHDQRTLVDGLAQETCRDFTHTGYGISAISHVAETAAIQGDDLYPEVGERLRHALEFHSTYEQGAAVPSWLCGGSVQLGLGPVTEVGLNALHGRQDLPMASTQALTESTRPDGTNGLFVAWETLTHADNPHVLR